jgi:hypothetical protein
MHTHTRVCVYIPTPRGICFCFVLYCNKIVIHLIIASHLTLSARFPPPVFRHIPI